MIWSLALQGWRHWNRNAQLSGSSIGARIRRWWWKTNNWPMEENVKDSAKSAEAVGDVGAFGDLAAGPAWLTNFLQYYKIKLGAGGD
jgi:hypothetical protein